MRDRRVFIKTLEGLQPVDVIFRRLDDSFCDPLELRSDSSLGVAGLVEAARAGNVAIANALGTGVVETPAIMPFLPGLCRAPARRGPAAAVGADLVVRAARRSAARARAPRRAGRSSGRSRRRRESRSSASAQRPREDGARGGACARGPEHFVAQEQVALSTAPVWHRHQLGAAPTGVPDVRGGRGRLATS